MAEWWKSMVQGILLTGLVIAIVAGATAVVDGSPAPTPELNQSGMTTTEEPDNEVSTSPTPSPSLKPRADGVDSGQWWVLVALGVVTIGVGVRMWLQRRRAVVIEEPEDEEAGQVLSTALKRLDEGEVSDAVTECWRDLERLAAVHGVQRGASEPAHDFAGRLALTLHLPAAELAVLGNLFEQAWYSTAVTSDEDIARARACLQALAAASSGRW